MTIDDAAPLAQAHAQAVLTLLGTEGIQGVLGRAIQYGHTFSVTALTGTRYQAILYVGKSGPRLVAVGPTWPVELWQTVTAHVAGSLAVPQPTVPSPATMTQEAGSTVIYVDGSYVESVTFKTVGWAFEVWQQGQSTHRQAGSFDALHADGTRNIAGECYAVLAAIEWCKHARVQAVEFRHDYIGLAHWALGTWQAKTPLTQHFATTLTRAAVQITWVKVEAHRGEVGNTRVDTTARHAAATRHQFTDTPTALPSRRFSA